MRKLKIIVDGLMFLIFLYLMGYEKINNLILHGILGFSLFAFFIIHHLLNLKWYKVIFRGNWNFRKVSMCLINLFLLLSMIGMIVSGIMLSGSVFEFSSIPITQNFKNLHIISVYLGFIIMRIHLAFHLEIPLRKLDKKMKATNFEYVYYLLELIIVIFGLYSLIDLGILGKIFLRHQYSNLSIGLFYSSFISITISFGIIVFYGFKIINKRKKEK